MTCPQRSDPSLIDPATVRLRGRGVF